MVVVEAFRRRVAGVIGVALLAGVVGATSARIDADPAFESAGEELVYLPSAERLRPLALGYDAVLADLIWFRTISYFGSHYASDRAYPWLEAMCDLVTDLDPGALYVYRFAGLILPWEAKDPAAGIRLLEKGIRARPDSWLLPYYLGIVEYLFQGDEEAAARHFTQAAALPAAPPFVTRLAALFGSHQHGPQTAIALLEQMRDQATSPESRAAIEASLLDARAAWDLQLLDDAVRAYRDRTGQRPTDLAQVVDAGLLRYVPPDRYGGRYEIDPERGTVRSSTGRVPNRLHESPLAQRLREEATRRP